jgi:hypothetical protein
VEALAMKDLELEGWRKVLAVGMEVAKTALRRV